MYGFAGVGVEQKRVASGAAQGAVCQEEIRVIRRKGEGLQRLAAHKGILRNGRDRIGDGDGCQELHSSNVPGSIAVRPLGRAIDIRL